MSLKKKTVSAHEIMVDDWLAIGENMFRVFDTGHVLFDVTGINHTALMLVSADDNPGNLVQIMIPLDTKLVVINHQV